MYAEQEKGEVPNVFRSVIHVEQGKGEVPNVFRSVIHVEQGKGKKAETIWTHYAVTLGNRRFDSVAPSAVLMARCTNSGSAAALAEQHNTEKNCHQKKIKREQKKSENRRKNFGHVNKILLPKKEAELTSLRLRPVTVSRRVLKRISR
jgi:hypothetical protein